MKQKTCLGDCYALINHKLKHHYIRYVSLMAIALFMCLTARGQDAPRVLPITGTVVDTIGQPIQGATVSIIGTSIQTQTDEYGRFSLRSAVGEGTLRVQFVGCQTEEVSFGEDSAGSIRISLIPAENFIEEVEVSTGYQTIPKERATGSFVHIDNELLNRRVGTNILDRLDGITSGLIFPKYTSQEMGSQPTIAIRGRSTIFASAEPLVILDNFPYDGDITNINPNDVESVTVLKDGAAASIWGAQSGNGVIVITTKQGKSGAKPEISVTANTTFGAKPDLYYVPQLTSSEYIEVEKFLYERGAFNSRLRTAHQPVSPVVELLHAMENGIFNVADGMRKIDDLAGIDARDQIGRYLYQRAVNQQYNVNISGGAEAQQYFVSLGYDANRGSQIGNDSERYTVNTRNSYAFFDRRLTLHSQLLFTAQQNKVPHVISMDYPYELLADGHGNALTAVGSVRRSYADTVGRGALLDWHFRPLTELGLRGTSRQAVDYRVNLGVDYRILKGVGTSLRYQYGRGTGSNLIWYGQDSYYVRNLVNQLTQVDNETGQVFRPVPQGEIRINNLNNRSSHYVRGQVNFDRKWNGIHEVSALAAFEATDNGYEANSIHLYGYDPATATYAQVDFLSPLPRYYGGTQRLQNSNYESWTRDRFRSVVVNAAYTLNNRYTLYASARRDESNLFGVTTNQRGVPLWSVGGAWNVHDESFVSLSWLNELKLRLSYGIQGNVDKSVSALLTANYPNLINAYGLPEAHIENPPNPSLRWEKVKVYNAGIDFSMWNGGVSGQIDVYHKEGVDLIANSPIASQTGITQFRGNTADILTQGVDVSLIANLYRGKFSWNSTLLYNYVTDKVTNYKVKQSDNLMYMRGNYINPLEGKPQTAMFSFKYAGLNENGEPLAYINGQVSNDYTAINNTRGLENMVYHGPRTPRHFGSLRNDFSYKGVFLSFNVTYQFDYYFRRQSLDNNRIYSTTFSHRALADYSNRWKEAGDESHTDVPALIYPANSNRTNVYIYSDALVERADHIRLQDIQFGVNIKQQSLVNTPFNGMRISAYINNLTIMWKANRYDIDPDVAQSSYPVPRTYSFNISATF